MVANISITELMKKIDIVPIIDLRSIENYNNNHITSAKNIPSEVLVSNPSKYLEKTNTYYLYCQKGIISIKICSLLNSLGYKTVNINGGYEAWILEK